jgi:hypothetical protein
VADQQAAPQGQQGQQGQQIQVPIDDSELENLYVNFSRVSGNADEVLIDVGFHSQVMNGTVPEPVNLSHRLIMNYASAKKLAEVLRLIIARHEQAFGVVETDVNRRLRQRPAQS